MLSDFKRIGEFAKKYPRGVAKAAMSRSITFGRYLVANKDDTRYLDYASFAEDHITNEYLKDQQFPESSLNYHVANPTIENIVAIITKTRNSPGKYFMCSYNSGYKLAYSTFDYDRCIHYEIFRQNIHRFYNSQDSLLALLRATFDNEYQYREYSTEHFDIGDILSSIAIDRCIDMM